MGLTNSICTTVFVSPVCPTPAVAAMAPFLFPYYWNPFSAFKVDKTIFTYAFTQGAPIWEILRLWAPGPIQTAGSISVVWSSRQCSWLCITGLHSPSPYLPSSGSIPVAAVQWTQHLDIKSPVLEPHSTGGGFCITTLCGTVDLHVSSISLAEQGYSETSIHLDRPDSTDLPLVAVSAMVSATVCGPASVSPVKNCCLNQVTPQTLGF